MPKDFTTLATEITDPRIKAQLQAEADLRKAELALSRLDSELAAGSEALKKMPAIEAELATMRKMIERPVIVEQKAPAKAAATQKRPTGSKLFAAVIGAELARRMDQTPPEDFFRAAFAGEDFAHTRRVADQMYKAGQKLFQWQN